MDKKVTVECVLCHHRETIELTPNAPFCSKCCGPMTAISVRTGASQSATGKE